MAFVPTVVGCVYMYSQDLTTDLGIPNGLYLELLVFSQEKGL